MGCLDMGCLDEIYKRSGGGMMRYICTNLNCMKMVSEKEIIRVPIEPAQYYCKKCYNQWRDS